MIDVVCAATSAATAHFFRHSGAWFFIAARSWLGSHGMTLPGNQTGSRFWKSIYFPLDCDFLAQSRRSLRSWAPPGRIQSGCVWHLLLDEVQCRGHVMARAGHGDGARTRWSDASSAIGSELSTRHHLSKAYGVMGAIIAAFAPIMVCKDNPLLFVRGLYYSPHRFKPCRGPHWGCKPSRVSE